MARPIKARYVRCNPEANYFKPRGIPVVDLEEVALLKDELLSVLAEEGGIIDVDGPVLLPEEVEIGKRIIEDIFRGIDSQGVAVGAEGGAVDALLDVMEFGAC